MDILLEVLLRNISILNPCSKNFLGTIDPSNIALNFFLFFCKSSLRFLSKFITILLYPRHFPFRTIVTRKIYGGIKFLWKKIHAICKFDTYILWMEIVPIVSYRERKDCPNGGTSFSSRFIIYQDAFYLNYLYISYLKTTRYKFW